MNTNDLQLEREVDVAKLLDRTRDEVASFRKKNLTRPEHWEKQAATIYYTPLGVIALKAHFYPRGFGHTPVYRARITHLPRNRKKLLARRIIELDEIEINVKDSLKYASFRKARGRQTILFQEKKGQFYEVHRLVHGQKLYLPPDSIPALG